MDRLIIQTQWPDSPDPDRPDRQWEGRRRRRVAGWLREIADRIERGEDPRQIVVAGTAPHSGAVATLSLRRDRR